MSKQSGFTLIELLVVISIIAILAIIGLTSYTTFFKNSRDARRQSDLRQIQSALEQYHADQKYYPDDNTLKFGRALISPDGTKTYLTTVPNDPQANPDYRYSGLPSGCSGSSCTNYCLYTTLESASLTSDSVCLPLPSASFKYGVSKP